MTQSLNLRPRILWKQEKEHFSRKWKAKYPKTMGLVMLTVMMVVVTVLVMVVMVLVVW